jgi:hypothetical protein
LSAKHLGKNEKQIVPDLLFVEGCRKERFKGNEHILGGCKEGGVE